MPGPKKPTKAQIDKAFEKAERLYGHRDYVTAIDKGYKWKDGERTDDIGVRIHVEKKKPATALEDAEIIPKKIDGVPVDVYEGTYAIQLVTSPSAHQMRHSVLRGGLSISHPTVTAGSIGLFAVDETDGRMGIVSNWHVMAGAFGRKGDNTLQPGSLDGGNAPGDSIAVLDRWLLDRDGDAAFAHLTSSRSRLLEFLGLQGYPSQIRDSKLGETLVKSGRTTGVTSALVDGEGTYFITYKTDPTTTRKIGVRGFKMVPEKPGNLGDMDVSSGGDSGSVWLNQSGTDAVGLHFAGEVNRDPRTEHAIACNLTSVMERLNLRLPEENELAAELAHQNQEAVVSVDAPDVEAERFTLADLIDAYELGLDAAEFGVPASGYGAAVFARSEVVRSISRTDIWINMRRFFHDFTGRTQEFTGSTGLRSVIKTEGLYFALASGVNRYDVFRSAGVSLAPPQIDAVISMQDFATLLETEYRAAGWSVI